MYVLPADAQTQLPPGKFCCS